MTDNDIIQALECCFVDSCCHGCPLYNPMVKECLETAGVNAVSIIKRQKAEIERLESHNNKLMETVENLIYECDCSKQETIKDFEEKLLALKIKPEFPWDDFYVTESMIKELVKEMIEEV
jgi:hypothetical protein